MIDVKLTYERNISREENIHYQKMVEGIIETGEIDAELNTDDIANIIALSLLRIWDTEHPNRDHLITGSESIKQVENVLKLYETLPLDLKERLLFSFGYDMVMSIGLDEYKEVDDVLRIIARKKHAGHTVGEKYPNIES